MYGFQLGTQFFLSRLDLSFKRGELAAIFDDVYFISDEFV